MLQGLRLGSQPQAELEASIACPQAPPLSPDTSMSQALQARKEPGPQGGGAQTLPKMRPGLRNPPTSLLRAGRSGKKTAAKSSMAEKTGPRASQRPSRPYPRPKQLRKRRASGPWGRGAGTAPSSTWRRPHAPLQPPRPRRPAPIPAAYK